MSEAETGLHQTTESALALSKDRLAAMAAPTQESAEPVGEQPGEAQDTAPDGAGTNPAGESKEPPKADWSFVADPSLRAALEAAQLPVEAHSKFKDWVGDYTRKTQAAKEAAEGHAAWRDVVSDPDLFGALKAAYEAKKAGRKPEPEKAAEPFKWASATESEIDAEITRRAEAIAAKTAQRVVDSEVKAPQTRRQQTVARAEALYQEVQGSMSPEQFRSAFGAAVQHFGQDAFTPDNVETLFRPFLDMERAKAELAAAKAATQKDVALARKATSPAGSSSPAFNKPQPRKPAAPDGDPRTAREATKRALEEMGFNLADLERAARQVGG